MSIESVCRICVENAKSYKSLYDSNGQKSDVYLLVVKYFDETIINFERAQQLKDICLKCLQKIQYFDYFQKSVIRAQEKLLDDHNEVKRENTLTGYDGELSFHINDKFKHDLPVKENNLFNQCNNEAVCVRPEESEHIKVPKLEIVDALSGDESIPSNHEKFLNSPPSAYSVCSFSDDRNQNIDLNESSSIEKSDGTNPVNKLKNEIRSEDIDKSIAKLLPNVEYVCVRPEESEHIEEPKLEIVDVFPDDESIQSYLEESLDSTLSADSVQSGFSVSSFSDDSNQNIDQNDSSIEKADENIHVNIMKNRRAPKRSATDIDNNIAKILPNVECGVCKEKQPTFTHLSLHFMSEHPEKECYAMCCGRKFKMRSRLAIHVNNMHFATNAYPCKNYIEKSDETNLVNKLKNKIRTPKDIDNNIAKLLPGVECGICRKMVPTFTRLLQHFKTSKHPAKKCFAICCGKKFQKRYMLARHVENSHSGPSVYSCKYCNKPFLTRRSCALHMISHKPRKPRRSPEDIDNNIAKLMPSVECGMCKEKQPTFTHLLQHFNSEHPTKECYATCCGAILKKRCELADHVNKQHSTPNASSCKTDLRTRDAAIAQLRPNLECGMCKETCTTFSLLQYHFESKHPLAECYIMCCRRKWKDRYHLHQHLQFHENPSAFECNVCNKLFAERASLLRHTRVFHPTSNVEIPKRINSRVNNDALCLGSDESKQIEVLNLEIV